MPISVNPKSFTLQPGEKSERFVLQADYLLFNKISALVSYRINDGADNFGAEGRRHQGTVGARDIDVAQFTNTDAAPQTVEITYGLGQLDVVGAVTILGGLTLPAGAATAAKQDTGNASLASMDGKLPALVGGKISVTDPTALPLPTGAATGAKQDTGNTSLAELASTATETPDYVSVAADSNQNFANCRSIAVSNVGTTNVTLTIGAAVRTLPAGKSVDWAVSAPLKVLATVNVAVPVGGACDVATTA